MKRVKPTTERDSGMKQNTWKTAATLNARLHHRRVVYIPEKGLLGVLQADKIVTAAPPSIIGNFKGVSGHFHEEGCARCRRLGILHPRHPSRERRVVVTARHNLLAVIQRVEMN
jgi:hypothetical protein